MESFAIRYCLQPQELPRPTHEDGVLKYTIYLENPLLQAACESGFF